MKVDFEEHKKMGRDSRRRFAKAMKRLGCDHHILKCPRTRKVTIQDVLEEVLKVVDEEGGSASERHYWSNMTVQNRLRAFRQGQCSGDSGFDDKVKAAVGVLGGGDLFHEAVTPEAVFDLFDDQTKAVVPLCAVWFHLGTVREVFLRPDLKHNKPSLKSCCACGQASTNFLDQVPTRAPPPHDPTLPPRKLLPFERLDMANDLRKKHALSCAQTAMEMPHNKEPESEFMKELREIWDFERKMKDDHYRMFLTALRRLGGEDDTSHHPNVRPWKQIKDEHHGTFWTPLRQPGEEYDSSHPNVTPQALYQLIMEQVAATGYDDGFWNWTMSKVEENLEGYRTGSFYDWTPHHHNAMLKAIADLGGDFFNEELVTPKAVMKLMERDVATNIHGVTIFLGILREALKKDPNDLCRYPRDAQTLNGLSFNSLRVEAIHALYGGSSSS